VEAVSVQGKDQVAATAQARAELREFLGEWEPLLQLFAGDILVHSPSMLRLVTKGWRHLPRLRGTAASYLNRRFSHRAVRAALSGAMLYTGLPPERTPALALFGLAAMFRYGYFIPEGGMGRLPEVLGAAVRQQGGVIHLNSRVNRIVVRHGRACAVDAEGAGRIEVDAVLSTTSGMHTYASLLAPDDIPATMARKLRCAKLSHQGLMLQLGLSNTIGVDAYSRYVLPWMEDQHRVFVPDTQTLRWPIYNIPTTVVPALAPPGGSVIEIFPPIRQDLAPADWSEEQKETVAAQAVARLREFHPLDIAARRILSPKEFQRHENLYAGALYGLAPLASPAALYRYRSPIRSLCQAGQTTWPGFGVASAGWSGVLAAEALAQATRE